MPSAAVPDVLAAYGSLHRRVSAEARAINTRLCCPLLNIEMSVQMVISKESCGGAACSPAARMRGPGTLRPRCRDAARARRDLAEPEPHLRPLRQCRFVGRQKAERRRTACLTARLEISRRTLMQWTAGLGSLMAGVASGAHRTQAGARSLGTAFANGIDATRLPAATDPTEIPQDAFALD